MNETIPGPLRVALCSIGIGRIQRGFERYFSDLFNVLRDRLDLTLYKSRGSESLHDKIPPFLRPATFLAHALPLGQIVEGAEYKHYKHDCLAFGLSLLPELLHERYDVLHVIDYPLAIVLERLQRLFRFRTRLLLTNGCCMPPQYYPRVSHVHHVAEVFYQESVAMGVPEFHLTFVPCGIHAEYFETNLSRQELRRKHGISEDTFVILAVTAVKRKHKRVDHIIEEVSRLGGDILLWIDGNPEDPSIPKLARAKLGTRCRITHLPSTELPELYHLADLMVHAALEESFGLAIVEALSTGRMVLTHDSPHFEWLVQDRACLVDMSTPGKLTGRLRELMGRRADLVDGAQDRAAMARQRFDWGSLTPAYIEMYRKVAALSTSVRVDTRGMAARQSPPKGTATAPPARDAVLCQTGDAPRWRCA